jgi:putative glutamine amidotransferase
MPGGFLHLDKIEYPDNDSSGYGTYFYGIPADDAGNSELPLIAAEDKNPDNLPVVAILLGRSKHPDREIPDFALTRWVVESVQRQGLFPVFITHDNVAAELDYWRPRGIVLPGGSFHTPLEWLAYKSRLSPESLDLARWKAYVELLEYAIKNKLPTIGLCGGMQVIGGFLGGKIMWATFAAPASKINHHSKDTRHLITAAPKSLLHEIAGENFEVNSFHIAVMSPDFIGDFNIVATAPDGIIEAIEPKNPWADFVLGLQWHPEKMATLGDDDHPDVRLFRAFADAIKK